MTEGAWLYDSLSNTLKHFKKPSCITLQETKLKSQNIKIPGYQVFFKNRENAGGGGLITAIDENLASIQVSSSEKDILVIQVSVGGYDIRVINGYGPQEANNHSEKQSVYEFWQEIENHVNHAFEDKCLVIMQLDANAKLGTQLFSKDPHNMSENGLLLSEMANRQNLHILNTDELCMGAITRHRKTIAGEEKSIIDYILVCDGLRTHFEYMIIDEDRTHVLSKYCTRRGIRSEIESDHNVQFAKFTVKYQEIRCKTIREIFNFKNTECQQKFFEVTENSSKLVLAKVEILQDSEWNIPPMSSEN